MMRATAITFGLTSAIAALALGGCDEVSGRAAKNAPPPRIATAMLADPAGAVIGRATAREEKGGLRLTVEASMLSPGNHGAHIHATGLCDAPEFKTAGGHWNPTGAQHGSHNPAGPHEGDLPNLLVGADGKGTLAVVIPGATIDGLMDADGAAMVIHAGPDDLATDPSGNSGARLACGVFALS